MVSPEGFVPTVFVSYSWDSEEHRERVLMLTEVLRREYTLDVQIDRYFETPPPASWAAWMHEQLDMADFVVVVCSEPYCDKLHGGSGDQGGRGIRWEGAILTQEAYGGDISRMIPVALGEIHRDHVPYFLQGTTVYGIDLETGEGLEPLARRIWNEPEIVPVPLGVRPSFKPRTASLKATGPARNQQSVPAQALTRLSEAVMAVQKVGQLRGSKADVEIEVFKLRTSINAFAEAMTLLSKSEVRAAILGIHAPPDPAPTKLDEMLVQLIASSSSADRERESITYRVAENSDFTRLLATPGMQPVLINDIEAEMNYRNSRLSMPPSFFSTVVWPIKGPSKGPGDGDLILGFLVIDSPATDAFDEWQVVPMGSTYASVLFAALLKSRFGQLDAE